MINATVKLRQLDWLKLIGEFEENVKKHIRDDFEKHIEEIREKTGFAIAKIDELSIDFKWKHDYYSEWIKFINEKNKDLLDEAIKLYVEDRGFFIDDNFVLGKYLKELACEYGVILSYEKQRSGYIAVFINGRSNIYKSVKQISNLICDYVDDYREKMQSGKVEFTDVIRMDWRELGKTNFHKLDNNDFKNLVEWRCQDEGGFIDFVCKEDKCLKVYIDC